jgi:hypothetical protein
MHQIDKTTFDSLMSQDLGERFFSVMNQRTVIEACAIAKDDTKCFAVRVTQLHDSEFDPNDAQAAAGDSVYYRCNSSETLRKLIVDETMKISFDMTV